MPQALANENRTGPGPVAPSTATHQGQPGSESTGAAQCTQENKKPSFDQEQDLRLQCIEALKFIEDMSPDMSQNDLFYFERARDILQRLVDEDDADRTHLYQRFY